MAGRLEGRVAVITGGASGIGRATARVFADEGADIVVADLNGDMGKEAVAEVEQRGRRAIFAAVDTTSEADNEAMARAAVDAFGRIDVLVAAAGISGRRGPRGEPLPDQELHLLTGSLERWQRTLDVNLNGVMYSDRAVAARMVELGTQGSIINIASIMAKVPAIGSGPYCVAKAGVWMLTKVLALELASNGIRVNAIGPGYIETPMTAGLREDPRRLEYLIAQTPMRRLGQPEEVAKTALFLASDESSYVTGEIFHPDGGFFTG